ncbi:MAG: cation diffusion facilitator family transporter [Thermoleophilia bacterium]
MRAIVAAALANLGIATAKFAGFIVTGSSSMLAESIHSLADTANQGLRVFGGKRAARPATAQHPFGYGRDRYFWAFVVAMVLFSAGGAFAVYEGIEKLRSPHEISSPEVAIIILAVAVVLELFSLRTAVRAARPERGTRSWAAYVRRSKSPELPVVLLEDLGALIGLVLALVGVTLAAATGEPRWDGAGTLSIGVLLVLIAVVLAAEMKSLLIGESATDEDQRAIRAAIEAGPPVRGLIHMRTLHLGPEELLVAAKIELDPGLSAAGFGAAIDTVEARIRAAVPIARVIYLEPDQRRPAGEPTPAAPPAASS